jgi:hypothetical protein
MLEEIQLPPNNPKETSDHEKAKLDVKRLIDSCVLNLYLHKVGIHDKRFVDMEDKEDVRDYTIALRKFVDSTKS